MCRNRVKNGAESRKFLSNILTEINDGPIQKSKDIQQKIWFAKFLVNLIKQVFFTKFKLLS